MKTMKLDCTGALWRLATFYGPLGPHHTQEYGTDICTYMQAVLVGIGRALMCCVVGGVNAAMVALAGAYWLAALVTGRLYEIDAGAVVGTAVVLVPPCAFALMLLIEVIKDRQLARSFRQLARSVAQKEPSAIQSMYGAWKNRYCHKIVFKD